MDRITRRELLAGAMLGAGSALLQSCSTSESPYRRAVAETWRPFEGHVNDRHALHRELVRYATLAPSSHNTQCWTFQLDDAQISIFPDFTRRLATVDPDDHHLFVSLGCAAENLVQAARAHGLSGSVRFEPAGDGVVRVALRPTSAVTSPMFKAIPIRQCSRDEYDRKPVEPAQLRALEATAAGAGVRVVLLTAAAQMESVLEYVVQGNTVQMNDPAFMKELERWLRFSDKEALATGDGLSSRASGSPVMPRALAMLLLKFVFTAKSENEKYARFIRSSAGIAVFVSDVSDRAHWVEAGRCYERFVLLATSMGIHTAMVNQPVEVTPLRAHFANSLGLGSRRPDLVVRFGHGPEMPRSLRRPLDAVLVR